MEAAEIIAFLTETKQTLATAESCTGGLIAAAITDIPGASACFPGGVVSYANEVKRDFLGVPAEILAKCGAVSEACARAMAEGVRGKFQTSYGLAATGIAGPGGGTPSKPVGLVFIAVSAASGTAVRELHLAGDREKVRGETVKQIFALLAENLRRD